jgi:hypothetical protein
VGGRRKGSRAKHVADWLRVYVFVYLGSGAVRSLSAPPSNGPGEGIPLDRYLFLLASHHPQFQLSSPSHRAFIPLSSVSYRRFSFSPPPHPRTFRISYFVQYSSLSMSSEFHKLQFSNRERDSRPPSGALPSRSASYRADARFYPTFFVALVFLAHPRIDVGCFCLSELFAS